MTVVSGNINLCRHSKAFLAGTSSNLSGVVESGITAGLIGHYDNTPLWVPDGTNKDNLE